MKIKQVLNSVNSKHTRSLLRNLYHIKGPGRKPFSPLRMLKAQLAKHLLRIVSDRRLALRLRNDRKGARACGFRRRTPSHGLFTHFRHRLGTVTYRRVFDTLMKLLIELVIIIGKVVAVDSTPLKAYSRRVKNNRTSRSDHDGRVGRGRRGFISARAS